MELRPLRIEDVAAMEGRSISRGGKGIEAIDVAYTLCAGETVLAIGGLRRLGGEAGWFWLDMSTEARSQILSVYRVVRDWVDLMLTQHGIRCAMCAVEFDFAEGLRLVEHLGFERQGTLPGFFGEKCGLLYVRTL